jgi:hypothetical protein
VHDGKVDTTVQRVEAKSAVVSLYDLMQDDLLEWGLLVGAGIFLFSLGLSLWSRHSS